MKEFGKAIEKVRKGQRARVQARLEKLSQKMSLMDSLIAATAQCHKLCLVTRNIKDFENLHVELFNPF